jgi:hypothetical protein
MQCNIDALLRVRTLLQCVFMTVQWFTTTLLWASAALPWLSTAALRLCEAVRSSSKMKLSPSQVNQALSKRTPRHVAMNRLPSKLTTRRLRISAGLGRVTPTS